MTTKYTYIVLSEDDKTARLTGIATGTPSGNIRITYITGPMSSGTLVDIPGNNTYKVIEIDDNIDSGVFLDQTEIKVVSTPFVSSFGSNTFSGCTGLTYLYVGIPKGVPTFGTGCFNGCTSLTGNLIKNVYNNDFSDNPIGGMFKIYAPINLYVSFWYPDASSIDITPTYKDGGMLVNSLEPALIINYVYYVNDTITDIGTEPILQHVKRTDIFYLTAQNMLEVNINIGTGQPQGPPC